MPPHQFNPRVLYIFRRINTIKDVPESHSHDYTSLVYILNGEGAYEFNGVVYPVKAGSFFICGPGVTHHRILTGDQHIEEFQVGVSDFCIKGLPENYLIPPDASPSFPLNSQAVSFLQCVDEIEAEQIKQEAGSPLMLKCLVMKLMIIILKEKYNTPTSHPTEGYHDTHDRPTIVAHVTSFLDHHYMNDVSLASLSETAYLSPIYISRIFKDIMGESPIQYLIRKRMNKACDLLQQKELSISQVASAVGYQDAFHFSKLFKKYYGQSPSEYRTKENGSM